MLNCISGDTALNHFIRRLVVVGDSGFKEAGDAVRSAAITIGGRGRLIENMLCVVAEFCFAKALRVRKGLLRFLEASEAPKTLTEDIVRTADVARRFLRIRY